jgi:hypothetical protein
MAKPEETNMSKNNDQKPEDDQAVRRLRSDELEHVSGGMDLKGLGDSLTGKAQLVPGLVVVR